MALHPDAFRPRTLEAIVEDYYPGATSIEARLGGSFCAGDLLYKVASSEVLQKVSLDDEDLPAHADDLLRGVYRELLAKFDERRRRPRRSPCPRSSRSRRPCGAPCRTSRPRAP
jgi:hypothetical protein